VDIEHLQRYPNAFTAGEPVVATEKIHGSCVVLKYLAADNRVLVSSKSVATNGIAEHEEWRSGRRCSVPARSSNWSRRPI
jgi:RNA ligase (TIGR02306 family)